MSCKETSFFRIVKFVKLIQKNVVNLIFVNCLRFTKREKLINISEYIYASIINTQFSNRISSKQ